MDATKPTVQSAQPQAAMEMSTLSSCEVELYLNILVDACQARSVLPPPTASSSTRPSVSAVEVPAGCVHQHVEGLQTAHWRLGLLPRSRRVLPLLWYVTFLAVIARARLLTPTCSECCKVRLRV
jgi:hypothetical protein